MRNIHKGELFIILGNGPSVAEFDLPILDQFRTIGVNEICRWYDPHYCVFIDPPGMHNSIVKKTFMNGKTKAIVAGENYWIPWGKDKIVTMYRLVMKSGQWQHFQKTDYEKVKRAWEKFEAKSDGVMIPVVKQSLICALFSAIYMGAHWVGVLGMDFNDGYRDEMRGSVNAQWYGLRLMALEVFGVDVVNLSPKSRITSIPYMPIKISPDADVAYAGKVQPTEVGHFPRNRYGG